MNAPALAQNKSKVSQCVMLSHRDLKAAAIHAPGTEWLK